MQTGNIIKLTLALTLVHFCFQHIMQHAFLAHYDVPQQKKNGRNRKEKSDYFSWQFYFFFCFKGTNTNKNNIQIKYKQHEYLWG